jgi:NAD(P)-dependent dehydrogenase (short-subunit alcohol dehydrogenase family)
MYAVPDQAGKLVVVTGANSGTGKEAARRLAGAGAQVVMAVRTVVKGERAREELLAAQPGARLEVRRIDLADLASVGEFAEGLIKDRAPVDLLINNAGYYGPSRWFGLVGPTTTVRPPRRARDTATAARLWAEAERLTGTALPANAARG